MQLGIVYYLMYLAYLDLYAIAKRIKCLKVGYEVTLYRVRLFVVHVLFQIIPISIQNIIFIYVLVVAAPLSAGAPDLRSSVSYKAQTSGGVMSKH